MREAKHYVCDEQSEKNFEFLLKKKIVTKNPCCSEASKRKKTNKSEDNCVSSDNNSLKKAWIDFIDNNDYVVS